VEDANGEYTHYVPCMGIHDTFVAFLIYYCTRTVH
jgi:hypothetical protein